MTERSKECLLAAIAYRFALDGQNVTVGITVLALLGSLLVSYTRARAEALGLECKVGLASRAERVVLLVAGPGVPRAVALRYLSAGGA